MGNLFNTGLYMLHSGKASTFKIDCDALTDEDIYTIAFQLARRLPTFGRVEGVPQGGLRLADAMVAYLTPDSEVTLIVDDVFTTGASMEEYRSFQTTSRVIGAVIFARSETPDWITPLFRLEP